MWADGITKGLMDRLIHRPRDGQMGQWTDRAMDRQTNEWTEGQTMDQWTENCCTDQWIDLYMQTDRSTT